MWKKVGKVIKQPILLGYTWNYPEVSGLWVWEGVQGQRVFFI